MAKEMNVYTVGKSKISREELKFCAKYMYSLLVNRKMHNATNIWIISIKTYDKQKLEGYVIVKGHDYNKKSPMDFDLILNTDGSRKRQFLALAHELVHVKQLSRNQLGNHWREGKIDYAIWKKRRVNITRKSYWDLPWEWEAHGKQEGLYHRYRKFLKDNKIKF